MQKIGYTSGTDRKIINEKSHRYAMLIFAARHRVPTPAAAKMNEPAEVERVRKGGSNRKPGSRRTGELESRRIGGNGETGESGSLKNEGNEVKNHI